MNQLHKRFVEPVNRSELDTLKKVCSYIPESLDHGKRQDIIRLYNHHLNQNARCDHGCTNVASYHRILIDVMHHNSARYEKAILTKELELYKKQNGGSN